MIGANSQLKISPITQCCSEANGSLILLYEAILNNFENFEIVHFIQTSWQQTKQLNELPQWNETWYTLLCHARSWQLYQKLQTSTKKFLSQNLGANCEDHDKSLQLRMWFWIKKEKKFSSNKQLKESKCSWIDITYKVWFCIPGGWQQSKSALNSCHNLHWPVWFLSKIYFMKKNMFGVTPANKVCFICYSNFRMGTCDI